ncbi:SUN domain-containing protein 2-like isoform X2 [Poeciliopsis prolifica]|uniref:SUN domain-containing protein 2-like isoform X2 n=1 Tax=Poeciliopsis prolifica TaxID=188132 RepID=UPI00241333A2|nr:SUN domain-containing protein 2-like isoform X2 [Poeciliopsis prolifica]
MQRSSERLLRNGYYDIYGQPVISYRETAVRRRYITGRPVSPPRNRPANRPAYRPANRPANRPTNEEISLRERHQTRAVQIIMDRENQMIDCLINIRHITRLFFFTFVTCACLWWIICPRPSKMSLTTTMTDMGPISGVEDQGHLSRLQMLEKKINYLLPEVDLWPNFALHSQGATILYKKTTESCESHIGCRILGVPIRAPAIDADIVIQGRTHLHPGQCWAFPGFPGRLAISLSHTAIIRHVSLGHIRKIVSPTSSVSSAPKEFSVFGKKNLEDEETHLGTFIYDENGDQIQTFKLSADKVGPYDHVTLQVNSNWGESGYTCLYDFRVHGDLAKE